ncbi:hypothetical protein V8G54_007390, partial [Vigna mungo]
FTLRVLSLFYSSPSFSEFSSSAGRPLSLHLRSSTTLSSRKACSGCCVASSILSGCSLRQPKIASWLLVKMAKSNFGRWAILIFYQEGGLQALPLLRFNKEGSLLVATTPDNGFKNSC